MNLDGCINPNYNYKSLRSSLESQPNPNKNNKNFISSTQENLVPITFGELIAKDKIRKNNSENMSVLQNDVCSTSRYIKILMDSSASALIIHDSLVRTNEFHFRKTYANKWSTMDGSFSTSCKAEFEIKL